MTFDKIGSLLIIGWLAFTSAYIWRHETEPGTTSVEPTDSSSTLEEGEHWMLLRRKQSDIGYIRRTTTRLTDGWLLEYETLVVVEVAGDRYGLDAEFDARLDHDAVMTDFSAQGLLAGQSISASGEVDGKSLNLTVKFGDDTKRHTVRLDKPPRLTGTRLANLADNKQLEPGDRIRQSVFAPSRFGMQSIVLEVVGRRTIDLVTRSAEALYLRQHIAGQRYDIYLGDDGEILLREFPFRIFGVQTDPEFASSRVSALRKKLESARELPDGSLQQAQNLLDTLGDDPTGGLLPGGPMDMLGDFVSDPPGDGEAPANAHDAGPAPSPDSTTQTPQ